MKDSSNAAKSKVQNLIKQATASNEAQNVSLMMSDARYLRQSSALINDALQKGFDVMQLADGSVVISGMKTVSYQYEWSDVTGKLSRRKSVAAKNNVPAAKARVNMEEIEMEEESEDEVEVEFSA